MQLLHNTAGLTIEYDPAKCWLNILWRGVHSAAAALQCYDLILTQVHQTGSIKILNDGSQDQDGWEAAVRGVTKDFFPQLAESGVLAVAWVKPHNLRAQIHMYEIVEAVTQPAMDTFTDVESAHRWLSQDVPLNQIGCWAINYKS